MTTMATYSDDWQGRGREEDAAAAVMNMPVWREATPDEREAVREGWLSRQVGDALGALQARGGVSEAADQWRAPGSAGHDEEWQRWALDEDRSVDRSDVLER